MPYVTVTTYDSRDVVLYTEEEFYPDAVEALAAFDEEISVTKENGIVDDEHTFTQDGWTRVTLTLRDRRSVVIQMA